MPCFKYHFDETQIAAIASYLKTVPPQAPAAPTPDRDRARNDM